MKQPHFIRRILDIARLSTIWGTSLFLAGCEYPQSALAPSSQNAEAIYHLFLTMSVGAVVIWMLVMGLGGYAYFNRRETHSRRETTYWIVGGGVVAPTLILSALLVYGLGSLPSQLTVSQQQAKSEIRIRGYLWWWEVEYIKEANSRPFSIVTANELCLPVDRQVTLKLESQDVVHSFWVPALGGKIDMIPGRTNFLTFHPTKTGTFRGACAEYCGESHTWMTLTARVVSEEEFERWLQHQSTDSVAPLSKITQMGRKIFLDSGCGACHRVRGTEADGVIAPDLTHLASRPSIGAGVLPLSREHLAEWIRDAKSQKAGSKMPSFDWMNDDDINALSAYLETLK